MRLLRLFAAKNCLGNCGPSLLVLVVAGLAEPGWQGRLNVPPGVGDPGYIADLIRLQGRGGWSWPAAPRAEIVLHYAVRRMVGFP